MSDNISKEIQLLTFKSLYNLLREEKRLSSNLNFLPNYFYESVDKFFLDKENEIKFLEKENNLEKLKKEKKILSNARKIFEEIVSLRLSKLSSLAIDKIIYNLDNDLDDKILNEREINFLDNIESNIKKFMK